MPFEILVKKLNEAVSLPTRAYTSSAALDLGAHLLSANGHPITMTISPGAVKLIGTGIAVRPPPGYIILVCSRSGLAARGVFVANAPGVVDPDYTGELKVALYNGGQEPHYVKHQDRIAQALLVAFASAPLHEVLELSPTERGEKGFGSTGD